MKIVRTNRHTLFAAVIGLVLALTACTTPVEIPPITLMPIPEGAGDATAVAAVVTAIVEEVGTLEGAAYPAPDSAYPAPDGSTAYPPAATNTAAPYAAPDEPSPAAATLDGTTANGENVFMPYIGEGPTPTPTPPPTATPSPTPEPTATSAPTATAAPFPSPTPIRVVDFESAAAQLQSADQVLVYNKIGFHVTFLEDRDELDGYMQRLDAEGVPFFLKSVDNAEPLYRAQELMKRSGVDHTLVYRSTKYDVPDYNLDPVVAAEQYWELEKEIWPPELDPGLVWFETMNELDKTRADWLATFSLRTAELALRDGYRWAAFGWASGEPEPADWESPTMLKLLRLIAEHPDQLAIALHEYSYITTDIAHDYPYKVGRFMQLFAAADRYNIPRPTVLITEWGWTYNELPPEPVAIEDVVWAARLYGTYPQIKGAAIWNLGRLDDKLLPLNTQAQGLIDNMLALSLDTYFSAPKPPLEAPLDPGQFPPPPVE